MFNSYNYLAYDHSSNTIYFDVYSGLIVGDGISTQSAALGLAHEMGHAAQDLDGIYGNFEINRDMREADNLVMYETPIATELGEPTRSHYEDYWGIMRMQNSTHYITKGQRPWWHYIAFWNWGKPKEIAIDHNL